MGLNRVLTNVHPIAKLAWLINVSVAAAVMSRPLQLLCLAGVIVLIFAAMSDLSLRRLAAYWKILLVVPLLLFSFHVLLYPANRSANHVLFEFRFLHVTSRGLAEASLQSLRLFCSVFVLVLFISTTEIKDLVVSLIRVRVPIAFSYAIYLMLRSIPVMAAEAGAIAQALKTRIKKRAPLGVLWLLWWRYVFALVLIGVRRAEQTALAMDARGFVLNRSRTFLQEPCWSGASTAFLVSSAIGPWALLWLV